MREMRLLSTSGILGYGFPEESLKAGLARGVDMIGVDGGSSDPGPYYLGSGTPFASPMAIRRDLRLMLRAALAARVPLVIGTCGGAGGEPHLALVAQMVREIAREEGLHFKLALIHAEQDKATIKRHIAEGRVRRLGQLPELDEAMVDRAERIVGMMGPEPYMRALDAGAQVVLGGRSSDPAPFAAVAMRGQMPPAPAWYAGKMLECGATPSIPKGHDCLHVTIDEEGVTCEPTNPARRCTPLSIANHSLHENSSPIHHVEPGGLLDTSECRFEALSDRRVRITGMRWTPAERYTVKLEAAEPVGHRAISICGTRDPLLIGRIDTFLDEVRGAVRTKAADFGVPPEDYSLIIRSYGHDGVMAEREPVHEIRGHELGFLIDVVARTPEQAGAVLAMARTNMLHTDFPGRLCREGNMAFPFSPSDIPVGTVYRFSMQHVTQPDDPCAMFPIEYETV
ncbi:acyclic terpene utilization AtuA family protein [Roseomonas sp. E05]|uniref:acyclic terpene utilization AtuA family protein n=1 Tax=Roseomonas sp. E05 TaxID=3046310 RepID=UPI0024B8A4D0|nr:acyclic terpene utilization AtuA family protein [Roseomonas sp. E05]MDJ0391240.1 acyclic terpene utilization AtuA family protein [Roseomonas sp. E05]